MRYRNSSQISPSQVVGIMIFLVFAGVIAWFMFNAGLWSKIWVVMTHNTSFWCVVLIIPFALPAWRRYKNPKNVTWSEVGVLAVTTATALTLFYGLFFYTSTDMADNELWNSYVQQAVWEEEYDTKSCHQVCDSRDKDGNCTSSHEECTCSTTPPSWHVKTASDESIGISSTQYGTYKGYFKTREMTLGSQGDACNGNPGTIHGVSYDGKAEFLVPTAHPHRFVNYLSASKGTIMKRSDSNTKGFEKFLLPYPSIQNGPFGPIEVNRVLVAGAPVPAEWSKRIDRDLDVLLSSRGKSKQVNVLLYVVATADPSFIHALESQWIMGKKNDFVIVIGAPEFPKISWVHVMAFWTDVELFNIQLRDNINNLNTLEGKEESFIGLIGTQIDKRPESGGWRRKPMADLEYLAGDISLPWWAHLCVLILTGFIAIAAIWALENNTIQDWAHRTSQEIDNRFGRRS